MKFMIVSGMLVCSSFLISVGMFIVSKPLLVSTNHKKHSQQHDGKETLMITYKAVMRPAMEYGSCILDQH